MLRTCCVLLAGLVLVAAPLSARAGDDESRALVIQAMKASGGKDLLKKYLGAHVKYKGTVDANNMNIKMEGEVFFNYPDRMKNVMALDINNMNITVQQGYDGKSLWINVMGQTKELTEKDMIAEMKESMYAEQVSSLVDLDNKEFKLSPLGEMKIMDKAAVGIRVSKEGKRDVNLWFDKKNHLVVKTEFRGKDPFGQMGEANQEKYFSNYKAVMGLQTPGRMEIHYDGKKMIEMEITEAQYHERLDDTHFQRP
jgi:outer membrane lipoprotein-sorting protein